MKQEYKNIVKMKKYGKVIMVAIFAIVLVGIFVFLYLKSRPEEIRYEKVRPEIRTIEKTTVVTGKIVPRDEINIKPQISGIITELFKEAGEMVKAGEVIAKVKVIPEMSSLSAAQSRVRLAEINLKQDDIVNMGMAKMAKAPVLLVGDIDRGGVFAQLYGTIALLKEEERAMVKATIVNKFRGDVALLRPGLTMLESLTGKPVAGVLPMLDVDIEDEDSLAARLERRKGDAVLDIAVIRLPHISNFTDFAALEATPGVGVRYVCEASSLGAPDLVILPGTKSTIADLRWLRQSGLEAAVKKLAARGVAVIGICGGYQMLGMRISDAEGAEGGGEIGGMGLLPVETEFANEKHRTRVRGIALETGGILAPLSGAQLEGYEIHMGRTLLSEDATPLVRLENGMPDGCQKGNVYGSYLHGFFDSEGCREAILGALAAQKGVSLQAEPFDLKAYKERQYTLLAKRVRENIDMNMVYRILDAGV